jgi:hypothetical protein
MPARRAGVTDPCGIHQAVAGVLDAPWPAFFAQWCRAVELGPVAARQARDVAGRLADPVTADAADGVVRGWAAVRDAMNGPARPAGGSALEATG